MPWSADDARRRSRGELAKHGIEVPTTLPILCEPDDLARLRPSEEVIGRTLALYAVVAVREGAPGDGSRDP